MNSSMVLGDSVPWPMGELNRYELGHGYVPVNPHLFLIPHSSPSQSSMESVLILWSSLSALAHQSGLKSSHKRIHSRVVDNW